MKAESVVFFIVAFYSPNGSGKSDITDLLAIRKATLQLKVASSLKLELGTNPIGLELKSELISLSRL